MKERERESEESEIRNHKKYVRSGFLVKPAQALVKGPTKRGYKTNINKSKVNNQIHTVQVITRFFYIRTKKYICRPKFHGTHKFFLAWKRVIAKGKGGLLQMVVVLLEQLKISLICQPRRTYSNNNVRKRKEERRKRKEGGKRGGKKKKEGEKEKEKGRKKGKKRRGEGGYQKVFC